MTFDKNKAELQYFTPGHRQEAEQPLIVNGLAVQPKEVTRWLGVFYDRHLRFHEHVCRTAILTEAATNHVRHLVGASYGTDPALLRQTLQETALTTLLYRPGQRQPAHDTL